MQPLFVGHRVKLVELALRHGFLLIAEQPSFATTGALAAYGVNRRVPFGRLATYVS